MDWIKELKKQVRGEVHIEPKILDEYSRDASLFEVDPQAVIYPKDARDVANIVSFVNKIKKDQHDISITARAAGTDMSGGPLNESIILGLTRFMNKFSVNVKEMVATVEPGVYYRDFEHVTLKYGLILPSYPASKNITALGGMIANNGAGERTLRYGKTADYVLEMKVVLADGKEYAFEKLSAKELEKKLAKKDFEGEIYRKTYALLARNYELVHDARPNVSKNSAGYALWDIWDREMGTFDLTRLFSGAQGTLGIMTSAKLKLVKDKKHKKLAVIFLKNLDDMPQLVNKILPLEPDGLETFDDKTLKLALRFLPSIAKKARENLFVFLLKFIPEALIVLRMLGLPKLVILAEFAEDTEKEAEEKLNKLDKVLVEAHVHRRFFRNKKGARKYWIIRHESFNLLRHHVKNRRTAPFIDDFIVPPAKLTQFLPKVYKIMSEYGIEMTLAGHAGSGNFHIIPLMDLSREEEKAKIPAVADKVYDLVIKYGGSITAEHNDGLIRSPYLEKMYGKKVMKLFEETKKIFDPQNIFNPGKKVNASLDYAMEHIHHE